ncbi:MAG: SDR family NAD(P)-dependent oxidoreductase [Planctomycetaceae bacterium]
MTEHNNLRSRTALVTGGSRGIGRACCVRLAKAGANVAVNFVGNEVAALETAERVRAAGAKAHVVRADVSDAASVRAMVDEVERALGPVDLLVNNAGIFDYVSHAETTADIWRRTMDVNLTGVFHVTWAVKDGMIARRFGRIVNVSSISGLRPRPMGIAYAAAKAGVINFTQSFAAAVAEQNVRVNAIAPGLIETDILDGVDPAALDALVKATPISRIGRPDDIAEVVEFLLSDRSNFMTGQTLVVDGGRVMLS